MKFNLKNRPQYSLMHATTRDQRLVKHSVASDKWFEGFEKELREKIDLYSPEIGWIRIKEILGE